MTSTMQRPPRPSLAPPSGPLPSLPVPKTRTPLPDIPDTPEDRPKSSGLPQPTPRRSATVSSLPTSRNYGSHSQSTPAVPTINTTVIPSRPPASPSPPTALPTLRKISSIGAFPLPPKGPPSTRVSSLPPSPLSTSESTSDLNTPQTPKTDKSDAIRHRSTDGGSKRIKTPRSSGYGLRARQPVGTAPSLPITPSLLNGSGENSFISSAEGARGSVGFLSLPSPPRSRSSSADDSCQTDGRAFEEVDGDNNERGRQKSTDRVLGGQRGSGIIKDTSKGNVVVSVRVRPDAGAGDAATTDGEWVVDGRRSLISYRGKEGGDHRYGTLIHMIACVMRDPDLIMCR